LRRYSVVIGSFKNKTNAYALKERMQNAGYKAILAQNEEGMLRVIVSSFDEKADAADSRDAIKAKYAPNFQDAWLLERQY
jgi:cell division septation protein DedD